MLNLRKLLNREYNIVKHFAAMNSAVKHKKINVQEIEEIKDYIKNR